jgi:hypothetical protein
MDILQNIAMENSWGFYRKKNEMIGMILIKNLIFVARLTGTGRSFTVNYADVA